MSALSFDSATHIYSDGERRYPSVTQIMRDCGLTSQFEFRDKIHAFRGSIVHSGSAIIIAGGHPILSPLRHPWDSMDDYVKVHSEIPGYWDAMRDAKDKIKFAGAIYECPLIDVQRGYAGMFDFAAYTALSCVNQLWDIKSGVYPPLTVIQVCAYEDLIRRGTPINEDHPGLPWLQDAIKSGRVFDRCGLRLEKTGRFTTFYECPKGRSYNDPYWMSAWRSALFLHRQIPGHEYIEDNGAGPHKKSMLSDLGWVAETARERLKDPVLSVALRAGENLFHLRQAYGML